MNLGLCIANLLRQYPEVDVPGIGVFRKIPVPAVFDAETATFSPPGNRIALDAGQTGGKLLTDYVKAQQQVDFEQATRLVTDAVQQVVTAARRNGRVLLSGLGYLIADGTALTFEQLNPTGLTFPALQALASEKPETGHDHEVEEPVAAATQPEETTEQTEKQTDNPATVTEDTPQAAAEVSEPPAAQTATPVDDAEDEPRANRTGWWVAAAAVVVLAAGIWFYRQASPQAPITGETEATTAEVPADSTVTDSTSLGLAEATVSDSTAVAAADTVVAPVVPATPSVTYEIIVGSFATMRQANKYVAEMKAKGYELQAIDSKMPGNRKKISWGAYATEEEAYRELVRVQQNFEPGAWIAKIEHD